jgi:hypothetical protein
MRVKQLKGERPHNQRDAEAAVGLGVDHGKMRHPAAKLSLFLSSHDLSEQKKEHPRLYLSLLCSQSPSLYPLSVSTTFVKPVTLPVFGDSAHLLGPRSAHMLTLLVAAHFRVFPGKKLGRDPRQLGEQAMSME